MIRLKYVKTQDLASVNSDPIVDQVWWGQQNVLNPNKPWADLIHNRVWGKVGKFVSRYSVCRWRIWGSSTPPLFARIHQIRATTYHLQRLAHIWWGFENVIAISTCRSSHLQNSHSQPGPRTPRSKTTLIRMRIVPLYLLLQDRVPSEGGCHRFRGGCRFHNGRTVWSWAGRRGTK